MEKRTITELLNQYGYNECNLYVENESLDIGQVFIKEDKEVYILIDEKFNKQTIEDYKLKLLWYQNWCSNDVILFNINLVFLYRKSWFQEESLKSIIKEYQKDSTICRKLFIDLDDESDLDMLPFKNIVIEGNLNNDCNIRNEVLKAISNEMYNTILNLNEDNKEDGLKFLIEM